MTEAQTGNIAFKELRLVQPGHNRRIEVPMFTSPKLAIEAKCDSCDVRYSPLPYQSQYEVVSQHFHEEKGNGGIYYYLGAGGDVERVARSSSGWIAFLEPRGRVIPISQGDESVVRARTERVMVQGIYAFVAAEEGKMVPLDEGVIFSAGDASLKPRPYGTQPNKGQKEEISKFHFQVREGVVMFSLPKTFFTVK